MADQSIQRKLAAILYADVAGYSRLTGTDEVGTHEALRVGLAILTKAIESHGGRVNHYAGDAILAEFGSVVDCVTTAIHAQRNLAAENADVPDDRKLQFRVGIHSGEVMIDGTEIYGDDVNIAARLESLAEPGGICVSGIVADQVGFRMDEISFEDMGDQNVKNIARPVRAYKLVTERNASPRIEAAPITEMPSIAVLPFDNLSGDADQEYFSDGITEDIITALSRLNWLFVTARNSSFSYKGTSPDVRDVAKDLGVRYVLEGSVRKVGTRVRITAQLIDGSTGRHTWAERYDRELEEVFELQDEITETVVGAIQPEITKAEIDRARAKPPDSLDAWDLCQQAMYHFYRQAKEDLSLAENLFRRSIEKDRNLATAYVGLSRTLFVKSIGDYADNAIEAIQDSIKYGRIAVELDRNNVDAYSALGRGLNGKAMADGDFSETISVQTEAVKINPNSAVAHYGLGRSLEFAGRSEAAIQHLETALRLSPRDQYNGQSMAGLAGANFDIGEYEKSLEWMAKAERSQSNLIWPVLIIRLTALVRLNRVEKAKQEMSNLLTRFPTANISSWRKIWGGLYRADKIIEDLSTIGFPKSPPS